MHGYGCQGKLLFLITAIWLSGLSAVILATEIGELIFMLLNV
jgi:hypothetical protein